MLAIAENHSKLYNQKQENSNDKRISKILQIDLNGSIENGFFPYPGNLFQVLGSLFEKCLYPSNSFRWYL